MGILFITIQRGPTLQTFSTFRHLTLKSILFFPGSLAHCPPGPGAAYTMASSKRTCFTRECNPWAIHLIKLITLCFELTNTIWLKWLAGGPRNQAPTFPHQSEQL